MIRQRNRHIPHVFHLSLYFYFKKKGVNRNLKQFHSLEPRRGEHSFYGKLGRDDYICRCEGVVRGRRRSAPSGRAQRRGRRGSGVEGGVEGVQLHKSDAALAEETYRKSVRVKSIRSFLGSSWSSCVPTNQAVPLQWRAGGGLMGSILIPRPAFFRGPPAASHSKSENLALRRFFFSSPCRPPSSH